jgi:hypothetical protein
MRIVLLAIVCVAGCAAIQTVSAQDSQDSVIEVCLAEAAGPDARRACVGRHANACTQAPGGDTTVGMVQCATAETRQWEAVRDRQIAALRARETETQRALLEAALAEHARWAQANCGYEASRYEGGTLARVIAATCMRDETAELTLSLLARDDEG